MIQTVKASAKKLPEGMQVEVESHGFKFLLDESPEKGGTGKGPNPSEVMLASFAACQTMVAVMLAGKMRIDLQGYHAEVEGDYDPEALAGRSDNRKGAMEIRFTMHFKSDAPREKLEKLAEMIEEYCPVRDTLANGTRMVRSGIVVE